MPTSTPPYPNQPVAMALIEVRHPGGTPLSQSTVVALKSALRSQFPLLRAEELNEMTLNFGPGAPPGTHRQVSVPRYVSRDRQSSVTYRPDAIVVETTNYPGWTAFKALVDLALRAREDVAPVDGVERIGIRFIDEIRIPQVVAPDWSDWILPGLTGPDIELSDLSLHVQQQQSVIQYGAGEPGRTLTLRYGAIDGPPAVISTPNLVRLNVPAAGPYFLIDTDAAWTVTEDIDVPDFDCKEILKVADQLHAPMKELFERLVTDQLREEVFGG